MERADDFSERLRWWRVRRGYSQLALAGEAAVSQRRPIFLELGRARPSREMVLRLAAALATLGAPVDVTAREIRIENFFPADAAGEALFHRWAEEKGEAEGYSTGSSRK